MKSIQILGHEAHAELEIEFDDLQSPFGDGDFRATCTLRSRGFAGSTHFWVAHRSLRAFSREVIQLEERRKGEANLGSMSPGELELRIYSTSPMGHFAVAASISHGFPFTFGDLPHSTGISFELDPAELQRLAKNAIIRTLAT